MWLGWFLVGLAPIGNVLGHWRVMPLFEAARFLYLPAAGLALAIESFWARSQKLPAHSARAAQLAVVVLLCVSGILAVQRHQPWLQASALARDVQATLERNRTAVPAGAAIDCSALPDNVNGAYAYRNGCDAMIRLTWPGDTVRGLRFVPGIPPDPVSARRDEFSCEFAISSDGRVLRRVRPAAGP